MIRFKDPKAEPLERGTKKKVDRKAVVSRALVRDVVKRQEKVGVASGKRGRGRPRGPETRLVTVALPPGLVGRLDEWAALQGKTRTAAMRDLLERGLK